MIECPECLAQFAGYRCGCGYMPPKAMYKKPDESRKETVLSEQAREWLEFKGIHKPGMSRKEKTAADIAYMKKLKTIPKPESHSWAYEIISRINDGEIVSAHAEWMAREVTGIQKETKDAIL